MIPYAAKMKPYLSGTLPMLPDHVCKREMPDDV